MRDSRAASLRFTLVVSAVLLALIAQVFIRYGGLHWAVAPLIVAVACLALESVRVRRRRSDAAPDKQLSLDLDALPAQWTFRIWNVEFTRSDLGWVSIITACLLMSVSLRNFGNERVENLSMAWYCFGAAVILLLVGIAVIDGRLAGVISRAKSNGGFRIQLKSLVPWLILGVILILATGVRVYNLEDVPAGLWHDEAHTLSVAKRYAESPGQIPVYESSAHRPSLFLMPVAALVKLVGVSITIPRLVAAAFGVLGIVAVFLLTRHILGTAAGLIAAFLVAFMRWDIIFSRIGFDATAGILFAALAGWLTLRAIRSGRHSDYTLAGVSLGLGMWFYIANQVFCIVIGFALLHHLVVGRPPFRRFALSVCLLTLATLFAAAPLAQFAADNPQEFFARSRQVSLFNIAPSDQWIDQIDESLEKHLLMLNRQGDPNPRHNLPDAPTLDFITGALFVLGFLFALTRWRNTALLTLPFWAVLMILPGVLSVPWESPQSLRSILVLPAVAALAAYPLQRLWLVSRGVSWPLARRYALPVLLGLLAVISYDNVEFYFGEQANDPRVYAGFSTDEYLMSKSQAERQRQGNSIWVSRQYRFSLTGELLGSGPKVEIVRPPGTLPLDSTQVWHGAAIYFEPRERGFWELARAYYPDGHFNVVTPPAGGDAMFYTALISREQLAVRQGLDVAYTLWNQPIGAKPQPIRKSAWHTLDGPEEYPYDLNITGTLRVDREGEYEFQLDGSLDDVYVELDGRRILGPMKPRSRVVPAVGMHSLKIVGRVSEPDKSVRLLWRPPGGEFEPIPYSHLYRGTVRPLGAVGRFFTGGDESVLPDAVEIAPSMDVFNYFPVIDEPHTVAWEGILKVEKLGDHKFAVERVSGPVKFYFENDLLAQDPPTEDVDREGEVLIGSGSYPIRVEYEARDRGRSTMFKILWQQPGENMTPIPVEALTPAREHILRVIE